MYSPEDRTAKAIIRDTAIELFGRDGVDAVPLRSVATGAGVSQALVIKHFGSRDGLIAAADAHALGTVEQLLHRVAIGTAGHDEPGAARTSVARMLGESALGPYLTRLLTGGGERARHAFGRLTEFARGLVDRLAETGGVSSSVDRDDLAVALLVHDLSALVFRRRITEALGIDPLDDPGAQRWTRITEDLYSGKALLPP